MAIDESAEIRRRRPRDELEDTESGERFDRMAFAARLLELLAPVRATVVLYERYHGVSVEASRHWSRGPGARASLVGVSPHASRHHIALAIAEAAGLRPEPLLVELLTAAGSGPPA